MSADRDRVDDTIAAPELTAPRLLDLEGAERVLLHFLGNRSLVARLVECPPKAALGIAVGIGTRRLLDGMTPTWSTLRVA